MVHILESGSGGHGDRHRDGRRTWTGGWSRGAVVRPVKLLEDASDIGKPVVQMGGNPEVIYCPGQRESTRSSIAWWLRSDSGQSPSPGLDIFNCWSGSWNGLRSRMRSRTNPNSGALAFCDECTACQSSAYHAILLRRHPPSSPLDMGRPTWTAKEEAEWLEARLSGFQEARAAEKTSVFITALQSEFFRSFYPDVTVPSGKEDADVLFTPLKTDENGHAEQISVAKRKDQIYWWMWNRRFGKLKSTKKPTEVLDLSTPKRTPKRHAYQAYITLYNDRMLPVIREGYETHKKNVMEGREALRPWLAFMADEAKALLAKEPQEVQDKVEEARSTVQDTGLEMFMDDGVNISEDEMAKRARTIQERIDALPNKFRDIVAALERQIGWKVTVVMGGPRPDTGAITTLAFHQGETVNLGNMLPESSTKWEGFKESFNEFVISCYAPETPHRLHEAYLRTSTSKSPSDPSASASASLSPSQTPENVPSSTTSPPSTSSQNPTPASTSSSPPEEPSQAASVSSSKSDDSRVQLSNAVPGDALDYEKARQAQIKRNQELLQSSGLQEAVNVTKKAAQSRGKRRPRPKAGAVNASKSVKTRAAAAQAALSSTTTPSDTTTTSTEAAQGPPAQQSEHAPAPSPGVDGAASPRSLSTPSREPGVASTTSRQATPESETTSHEPTPAPTTSSSETTPHPRGMDSAQLPPGILAGAMNQSMSGNIPPDLQANQPA
ncbi:hypothetical protein L226DRAFT_603200 [Lentinus tigrinus ALCF2SS1-7]|uniref:Uncharacterized protein n=1 Tax=Lentinus tigrinus ALCF2SS1-6 TaxID=1328759 RepID=A0A5C2RM37_9APHY|nr:hypothetical protein L227DRAFT_568438 [Lentinus tigrinus ALCF2SS1-6]RPD68023.1 hypothetical protein L226DRAFT_603200 [Lentinus tigrinus ALCF2SS1-7]